LARGKSARSRPCGNSHAHKPATEVCNLSFASTPPPPGPDESCALPKAPLNHTTHCVARPTRGDTEGHQPMCLRYFRVGVVSRCERHDKFRVSCVYRVLCVVPCAVCRVPCAVCRVPCAVCRVPCAVCRVPCAVCRVPCAVRALTTMEWTRRPRQSGDLSC
jgi:hypothetical protein